MWGISNEVTLFGRDQLKNTLKVPPWYFWQNCCLDNRIVFEATRQGPNASNVMSWWKTLWNGWQVLANVVRVLQLFPWPAVIYVALCICLLWQRLALAVCALASDRVLGYNVHCTIYNVLGLTLYGVLGYNVHCTMCNVQCTMCNVLGLALYRVLGYNVQCAMCNVLAWPQMEC